MIFLGLDWKSFPTVIIGNGGQYEESAVDGMIDQMIRTQKDGHRKWIEITLPDFILIPQVKFFTVGVIKSKKDLFFICSSFFDFWKIFIHLHFQLLCN